jgi:RNA polymerase sigma-70 factor (ECF subfamily)
MSGTGLEELFDRYRSAGDLDALAEVFDRTADQLLKVARHVARDEAQAEDLVQATFLAAIEHAERFDASRELVPWLVGILTNKAQVARAIASRAADPERLAERASEDPAHDTEIREFMATLERALERVPDAYRQVLRIHLAEGKGAEEIAHEVKRPAGTVRVQLHRGLKALRRLLPAGFALGGIVVLTSPRGLAAIRANVLGRASVLAKAGAAGVAGVSTAQIVGGVLVGKKIAAAAAILIVASGALWMAKRDTTHAESASVVTTSEPAQLESSNPSDLKLADAGTAQRETLQSAASTAHDDPYGSLDMEWVWADGTPAAGIGVAATPMGEDHPSDHSLYELTDEQGHLTVERVHEGKVYVVSDRGCSSKWLEISVTHGHRTTEKCTVAAGEDVRGRVLDAEGNPVPGASVWLMVPYGNEGGVPVAQSAGDGTYYARAIQPDCGLFATADRFGSSLVESIKELDPQKTGSVSLDIRLRGECGTVAGIVRDPEGKPIADAWVTVRPDPSFDTRNRVDWPGVWAATPADGSFRFEGLHKGPAAVEVTHTGFAVLVQFVRVEEGGTTQVDARVDQGFAVEGVLHASDGSPIAGADVTQGSVPGARRYVWQRQLSAKTDADGRYRIARIPSGEVQLTVVSRTPSVVRRATTQLRGKPDDSLTWNPELKEYGKIVGRVVDESGRPLEGWSVETGTRARIDFIPRSVKTDAQGRFELLDCADVPFFVAAYPPAGEPRHFRAPAEAQTDNVRPGRGELVLTVTAASRSTAFMTGKILDEQDKPVEIEQFWARNGLGGQSAGADVSKEDGSFRLGPMPSGTYTLSVTPKGRPTLNLDPITLAPEEQRDLGVIRIRALGKCEVVLRREDGESIPGAGVLLYKGPYAVFLESKDQVTFKTDDVYPGTYTLFPTGKNIATEQRTLEIASGETTRAEVRARAGVLQRIDFPAPDGETAPWEMRVVVRQADGAVLLDRASGMNMTAEGIHVPSFFAGYAPGRYTYAATAKGWEASGSFEIADTLVEPAPIRTTLVRTR